MSQEYFEFKLSWKIFPYKIRFYNRKTNTSGHQLKHGAYNFANIQKCGEKQDCFVFTFVRLIAAYTKCTRHGGTVCRYLCEQQIDFRLSGRGLLARGFAQDDIFPEIQSRQRTCDLGNGRSVNSTCAHVDIFLLREHASSLSIHSFIYFWHP